MAKVQRFEHYGEAYGFDCPGCKNPHIMPVTGDRGWGFNHNLEKPTFTPSILARGQEPITDEELERLKNGEKLTPRPYVCHSFVTDGQIKFLDDCTHALKGKTVELSETEEE